MAHKDVCEIIKNYLETNGFDGLQNGAECGCVIKDLMPCGEVNPSCSSGYKVVPPEGLECDFDFYICENKGDEPYLGE